MPWWCARIPGCRWRSTEHFDSHAEGMTVFITEWYVLVVTYSVIIEWMQNHESGPHMYSNPYPKVQQGLHCTTYSCWQTMVCGSGTCLFSTGMGNGLYCYCVHVHFRHVPWFISSPAQLNKKLPSIFREPDHSAGSSERFSPADFGYSFMALHTCIWITSRIRGISM